METKFLSCVHISESFRTYISPVTRTAIHRTTLRYKKRLRKMVRLSSIVPVLYRFHLEYPSRKWGPSLHLVALDIETEVLAFSSSPRTSHVTHSSTHQRLVFSSPLARESSRL